MQDGHREGFAPLVHHGLHLGQSWPFLPGPGFHLCLHQVGQTSGPCGLRSRSVQSCRFHWHLETSTFLGNDCLDWPNFLRRPLRHFLDDLPHRFPHPFPHSLPHRRLFLPTPPREKISCWLPSTRPLERRVSPPSRPDSRRHFAR